MIQKLRIKNYQSHKDTTLILHPGVNVIVGQSQNGKSALLRSLVWVKDNRPLGFGFNSWFTKGKEPTEVEVQVDGISIIKTKSKSKTTYTINEKDLDYKEGKGIPDEVTRLLNLSELNIQPQLDPFFLINSSPQEVARTFNRVTKVEHTDKWVSGLTTKINSNSIEINLLKKEIEHIEIEIQSFPDIKKVKSEYKKLKAMSEIMEDMEKEKEKLISIIENIKETESMLERRYLSMPSFDDKLVTIEDKRKKLVEVEGELRLVNEAIENIYYGLKEIEKAKENEDGAERDYREFLGELGKCPTCFDDLTPEKIERMVEE